MISNERPSGLSLYNQNMITLDDRIKECRKDIEESLKKHELALDCYMILKAGSVTPVIDLVEMKKESPIVKA